MTNDLERLDAWAAAMLSALSPSGRRNVMRQVGQELRKRQKNRITAQTNPDGSKYADRKPRIDGHGQPVRDKRGRIKRAAMFMKLRTARYMVINADAAGVAVGFDGNVARIASVHQLGLVDRVAPGGVQYKYPVRALLSITDEDREMIRDLLLDHLTKTP